MNLEGFIRFAKGGPGGKGDPAGGGRGEGIQSLLPLQHILVFTAIPKWDPHFADGTRNFADGTYNFSGGSRNLRKGPPICPTGP